MAEDNSRLDAEWTALNAVRELLTLAFKGRGSSATYEQAIAVAEQIIPNLFGEDSLIKQAHESDLAREYRQLAQVASIEQGTKVDPLSLLRPEIAKYDNALKVGKNRERTDQIKRKLNAFRKAEDELDPKIHNETELIFRDAYGVARKLPEIGTGRGHKDYELPDKNVLRIRVFHPDGIEKICGADMLYERHSADDTASVVAVQYKIWDERLLRMSDERLCGQIDRMTSFFCDHHLCVPSEHDNTFRFPFCSAFLRPTDKLQTANQRLASTGEHIPVCRISELTGRGKRGGEVLTYDEICHLSLSHGVFEELFSTGKLGSRTLNYSQLQELYQRLTLQGADRVFIHAQDFPEDDFPLGTLRR
jgi:hypothetical protein